MKTSAKLLESLNATYYKLHKTYEDLFWLVYMGDYGKNDIKDAALAARDAFLADPNNLEAVTEAHAIADAKTKKRLQQWIKTFEYHQTPAEAVVLKQQIDALESRLTKERSERTEGYIDPVSKKFVAMSSLQMRTMMSTHENETIRKACFEALENLSVQHVDEYVELVGLRNQYAHLLGYEDFYDMKVRREDGMTKQELFAIFDAIYEKTNYAQKDIRDLEASSMKGLRKPWNFNYMLSGDFTKEADPYFQFDEAVERWGRSFANMGIDFGGSALTLDLLDRKGKWNNGFCHWPEPIRYKDGKRVVGKSNFTCNVVWGQVGSGHQGYVTLFHEGGHAAHLLNSEQHDVCNNTEYAPMSASFAETHSMFLDEVFESIEWKVRYAKDASENSYPLDLFERKQKKLHLLRPLDLYSIMYVADFERTIYESKKLTSDTVLHLAKAAYKKYFDYTVDSFGVLRVPHIYGWESAAAYHGYGLATLALEQWREYFYKKYGYIVDNPNIGKEMKKTWVLGSTITFAELVRMATGKSLTPKAYLKDRTATLKQVIATAKKRIANLPKARTSKPIDLKAIVRLVHGDKVIATNTQSFEVMAKKYKQWLTSQSSAEDPIR